MRKRDVWVARTYLSRYEIATLNRLMVSFLETTELRTNGRQEIQMSFWRQNADQSSQRVPE